MSFEDNHIKAQDAYLRQACDATAEATVARMFDAIGYRPGMVIVPASRIEKLEKILRELVCDCAIDCPHFRDPLPSCMCYGAFPKEKKND
jgi:hypothetical protein